MNRARLFAATIAASAALIAPSAATAATTPSPAWTPVQLGQVVNYMGQGLSFEAAVQRVKLETAARQLEQVLAVVKAQNAARGISAQQAGVAQDARLGEAMAKLDLDALAQRDLAQAQAISTTLNDMVNRLADMIKAQQQAAAKITGA